MSEHELSLRSLIKASGKTQAQIADEINVDRTYVSQMVNGKVNWTNSAYFPALVTALGLTFRQVEKLRPDAVTQLMTAAIQAGAALADAPARRLRTLPEALQQMIEEKVSLAPELADERWQQYLAGQRFSTGGATPERWWNLFLLLKNAGVEPGGN